VIKSTEKTLEETNEAIKNSGMDGLWKHYLPLARADVVVASLVINLLSLALPILTLQIYDRVIPNNAISTLTILSIGLIISVVFDVFLKTVRAWLAGWTGARYEHQANVKAMDILLRSRLEEMEKIPAGIHLDRITSIDPIRDFYASQASLLVIDLPFAIIFLSLMAYVAGWLVMIPIVLIIMGSVAAILIGTKLRRALAERLVWDDRRFNFLIEALGGIHTLKAMAMEPLMERRYERLMHSSVEVGYEVTHYSGLAQSVGGAISMAAMIATVGIGSLQVIDKNLSIGALAACILLTGRSINPILKGLALWTRFQSVAVAEEKLSGLSAMPPEEDAGSLDEPINSVELRNITYAYGEDSEPILKNLNLSVRPGEIIAIQGNNGSGKSTLLHMLMGRLVQTEGDYLINGKDGHTITNECRDRQMAYLPQRPTLLKGTVLDNLTMFDETNFHSATDLAEKLGLNAVFAHMPDGYETQVGNTAGNALPAGVTQRISIARGLAGRPRIVLFDEANAMLDGRSDPLVRSVMEECRSYAAVVIVSYRPSLLSMADRSYELKNGTLMPLRDPNKKVKKITDDPERRARILKPKTGQLITDQARKPMRFGLDENK